MFKNQMVIEVKGAEKRVYTLNCHPHAPLGEIFDAVCSMKGYVMEQMRIQEIQENEKKKEEVIE